MLSKRIRNNLGHGLILQHGLHLVAVLSILYIWVARLGDADEIG